MKRLALTAALFMSGCATTAGGRVPLFFSNSIALTVIHTCTERALIYSGSGGVPARIVGATPQSVVLTPIFGDHYIHATVQSLNANGQIVGIYVASFYNGQGSSYARTWVIGNASGPGGGDIVRNSCQR